MRDTFIFHLYTNMKSIFIQQILSGSSFVSPALGGVGQGRLNTNNNFPPKKIWAKPKQAGKKKKGCGENEFLPACQSAEGGLWGGKRFRNSASAERQNRKIFVSLIEKNFGGARLKKCRENFSVLFVEAKRRRTETLGGNQSAKSSGFCSKKVRILTKRYRQFSKLEFWAIVASPSLRSGSASAVILKGNLKSKNNFCPLKRKFILAKPKAKQSFANQSFFLSPLAKGKAIISNILTA